MRVTSGELKNIIKDEILLFENREERLKELEAYVNKGSYVEDGYFVHFFELENVEGKDLGHKFGINPKSVFNTPLGIYGYPLTTEIFEQINNGNLPYALDRTYIHVFKAKEGANVINLDFLSDEDVEQHYDRLKELYPEIENLNFDNARVQTTAGYFWYITWIIKKNALHWNKIFRQIGIDGIVDNGNSIIHPSEPNQCVFFHKLAIDHVDTIKNPTEYSEQYKLQILDKFRRISTNIKIHLNNLYVDLLRAVDNINGDKINDNTELFKNALNKFETMFQRYINSYENRYKEFEILYTRITQNEIKKKHYNNIKVFDQRIKLINAAFEHFGNRKEIHLQTKINDLIRKINYENLK